MLSSAAGRKSTHSENAACVVVVAAPHSPWVGVRDSKLADADSGANTVVVPLDGFRRFVNALR
uniref:DUF397 domain-containing protein n=1 Tax=Saccharothrix mutabilis TaxID=33921 RepID=UPI0031DA058E